MAFQPRGDYPAPMFLRLLIASLLSAIVGGITALPRLEAAANDPAAVREFCEIGMAEARWQDPPLFGQAQVRPDRITVEVTGKDLFIVCPVTGGDYAYIVVIAQCPTAEHKPCSARRLR